MSRDFLNRAMIALSDLKSYSWRAKGLSKTMPYVEKFLFVLLNDYLGKNNMWREARIAPYFSVKNDEVFIDIGANVGYYTTRMARKARSVIAFEPVPSFYKKLKRKTSHLHNVRMYPFALGSQTKKVKMYVLGMTATACPEIKSGRYVYVECRTLDSVVNEMDNLHVGLIKIDVDGGEYDVLKGCENTLMKHSPRIILEMHGDSNLAECTKFLKSLGYGIRMIKEKHSKMLWIIANKTSSWKLPA